MHRKEWNVEKESTIPWGLFSSFFFAEQNTNNDNGI